METKKLTCRDLMVGDWVNIYKFTNEEQQVKDLFPARVTCILSDGGNNDFDTIECVTPKDGHIASRPAGTCLPIPLSAEILEKNGWYIPTNSCWWHNNEIDFYLVGYTNGDFKIYTDGDSEFSDLCRINHVHELQNLYRICRINKEIVL